MGEPRVDLRLHRRDGTCRLAGGKASDQGFDFGGRHAGTDLGQSFAQGGELGRRHDRIGKAGMDRVGAVHGLPGQSEIGADLSRRMRQQPGAADIGKEAEADFGHRQLGLVGDDAMAGVRRQPDAAAHHDAVHEGDIGLWEFLDAGVEDVFLAPQDLAEIALRPSSSPRARGCRRRRTGPARRRLPAGSPRQRDRPRTTSSALSMSRNISSVTALIAFGRFRRMMPAEPSLRAIRSPSATAASRHRAPSISLRDTISRMISLVPSRIWCTRRSRTIFSMPYSLR